MFFTLFYNNYGLTYLLAVLSLGTCCSASSSTLTKYADILVDENTGRPEVEIHQGMLRGVNMVTHHGRNIFGFKRIPYAEPPVGNLRFEGPLPPKSWNGTLDASGDSNYCPQMDGDRFLGDEDCLYLHVYTPRLPTSKNSTLLPVILLVFGGRFKAGNPNPERWGPHFLLDKDVILVVPSYRLGVLGFLSTGDEVSPGNYGLKDMVRALEWNRDNIQYFGGDPNRVTLFGSSSGAISVHLLTLSNSTNGLFQRYILNSGSALSPVSQSPRKVLASYTTRLGKYFGCPSNTSRTLVNCLRGINASQLVDTDSLFYEWDVYPLLVWGPTVEPDIEGALLTDSSVNLINAGKIHDLPWLHLLTRDEGIAFGAAYFDRPDKFEEFLKEIDTALPPMLRYDNLVDDVPAYTAALKSYYLNDLTADRTSLLANYSQLIGDAIITYPAYRTNQKLLVHAKEPQYFCSFEYRGTFSYSYPFSGGSTKNYGVCHVDEMIYLIPNFQYPLGPPGFEMNEADWKMVDIMVQLWTSFVINGTPTTLDPADSAMWERYSSRKNYLRIGNNSDLSIGVGDNLLEDRMQFWEQLTAATSWK